MKDVRLYSTEKEQIARELLGTDSNFTSVNMKENSLDSLIKKEKARKFNSEVEQYNEKLEQNHKDFKDSQDKIEYDINKAEIKPMFARVLVQPFKVNPFQKMKVENGLIVDTGGYTPHTQLNEQTGRYEEQKQFIVTGCVIEVGPEVKYLKEGDVIFYRVDTAVPVPFFKQGFVSLAESQIIATVAENLTERFNSIKNNA
jgi:hypothetical protein